MKFIYAFILMSCFFCTNLLGQEVVNKDTIGHNTTIKTSSDKGFISFDRETSVIKNVKVSGSQNYDSATVLDINTESPFYIPAYHINSSPMFYGDYSSCRQLFPNLYGSGSQTTIPGIGRVNQVSIFYQRQLNAFFDINAGINAVKFNLPYSIGQSFGMFGSLTYHPNEVFRIKIFGAYSPNSRYNFNNIYYGTTIGYDFTDRFGMEVGIQRYYDIQKGWQITQIVTPYYKFNKFSIGIDMGGMIYNMIQNTIDK